MVEFVEEIPSKSDHLFVKEDPARIYRGLKDLLVDEFDIDRIEEGHMEFNMEKPKDRVRMHAFKEKSPHTVIHYGVSFKAKEPRDIYKYEREDDILKARIKVDAEIITTYPGREPISWLPYGTSEWPDNQIEFSNLKSEDVSRFERSKFYEILVGIWYNKFYQKEITRYEEEAEETILRIHNIMREKFGVEKSIARTGASQYQPPWS
jgi:hypothetical protein